MDRDKVTFAIRLIILVTLHAAILVESEAQENHAPRVEIKVPKAGQVLDWNKTVSYSIDVSDEEDGYTAYEEIQSREVLLELKYVPDADHALEWAKHAEEADQAPLFLMSRSTCFTCHAFSSKLIGPSFTEISTRYKDQGDRAEVMVKRVINGSKGHWGEMEMSPHPDLAPSKIRQMVDWILGNGTKPDVNYLVGTAGAFKTKEFSDHDNGAYILTALYKDHGLNKNEDSELVGKYVLTLPVGKSE